VEEKCQIIQESPELCDWPVYVGNAIHLPLRIGKASPAAFSPDCQTLRIGNKLFAKDSAGNFVALPRLPLNSNRSSSYVEEFCRRGRFIVIATRTTLSERDVTARDSLDANEVDRSLDRKTVTVHRGDHECSSDDESTGDTSAESDIDTESEDDGYESWSDSSTIFSEDYTFDDDMITPWADHFRDENKDSTASDSEIDSESDSGSEAVIESESSDEEDIVPSSAFGYGKKLDDDEYDWDQGYSSDEDGYRNFAPGRHKRDIKPAQATITIYDAQASPEVEQLFRLTRPLQSKVYGSPPIIHPTRSLVVWPLGAGDVLFVDFMDKSYFVRRLRPSTLHSKSRTRPHLLDSRCQHRRKHDTFS